MVKQNKDLQDEIRKLHEQLRAKTKLIEEVQKVAKDEDNDNANDQAIQIEQIIQSHNQKEKQAKKEEKYLTNKKKDEGDSEANAKMLIEFRCKGEESKQDLKQMLS